ncbi:MAG: hypothetical protein GYA23_06285 [Methanomicrobiales archaeon]|nr:hypothetical protein [Methanomicrobiales archaeon]
MQDSLPVLELVGEAGIDDLLEGAGDRRHEASGVFFKDAYLYIIFDDDPHLLRMNANLTPGATGPELLNLDGTAEGYEDITYDRALARWYCLIEAATTKSGEVMPRVDEFDESFSFIRSSWLEFPLKSGNKGFEGIAVLDHGGNHFLLGLCEGNNCKGRSKGAKPGNGRIQVFLSGNENWKHAGTIRLPGTIPFQDYSSLDIHDGKITVLSQESSALWTGRLRQEPSGIEDIIEGNGTIVLFPRDEKGRILYCNLEGLAWAGEEGVFVVSDKGKADQPKRCRRKHEGVHLFRLSPAGRDTDSDPRYGLKEPGDSIRKLMRGKNYRR